MTDLLMSVFITSARKPTRWNVGNRYDRLDVFKATLTSYSRMKWDKIYLLVELDDEFKHRAHELKQHVTTLFGTEGVTVKFTRFLLQEEWRDFFAKEYPSTEDRLVWFSQCDDHIFIDTDLEIVNEGFDLLRKDTSRFKTMFYSHWPEILRLSGKFGTHERVGNYIKFKCTLVDAIQVFNLNYLKYLFTELDWRGKPFRKIDNLVLQRSVWCDPKHLRDRDGHYYMDDLQVIYVPLRELARHFDGYIHVWIKDGETDEFPLLKLPIEANTFDRSPQMIKRQMQVPHTSEWTEGNTFTVPDEWVNHAISLYSKKHKHTIITTSYECYGKGVQFMRENLEAVFSQTHRPLQCIVSDHSKNDDIENLVKSLDSRGVEVVYVRYTENYGNAGENWNNGFKYATGDTIQYNCMDERLAHPNAIADALAFMKQTGAQWIACAQRTEPKNDIYVPYWNPRIINCNTISGPTAVIIRSTLKDIMLDPQFFYYIDTEWYYRLGKRAGPPAIFTGITYIGRIHELQMTNTFSTPARIALEEGRLYQKYGPQLPTC
jgi:hypothetical protein